MKPASLMEVPPEDRELEKILEEADNETAVEETEESEDTTEDEDNSEESIDVDYSTMKVAELKELLKEKDLPVSGTKAELIERLKS